MAQDEIDKGFASTANMGAEKGYYQPRKVMDPESGRSMQKGRPVEAAYSKPEAGRDYTKARVYNKNVERVPSTLGTRLSGTAGRAKDPLSGMPMKKGSPVEAQSKAGPLLRQVDEAMRRTARQTGPEAARRRAQ